MNALRPLPSFAGITRSLVAFTFVVLGVGGGTLHAQGKKKNPASKVFFADVNGEAVIDTGDSIQDVAKRSVYTAQGTVIETRKSEREEERGKAYSTMVYSNGTGAFFDADTRVEVKNFVQEPFTPNRSDVDVEPSISQTSAFVARGAVGLCTSKLVAGSAMNYQTPHGSVNIRGRKLVIEAQNDVTKISMLEGESTVRGGATDMGGHVLHAGEQALIRTRRGEPNIVEIRPIPPEEAPALDEKITIACNAKKTVYFEVREKNETNANPASGGGEAPEGGDRVTAFDGDSNPTTNGGAGGGGQEIVPVEIVPIDLPTQVTETPARVETRSSRG